MNEKVVINEVTNEGCVVHVYFNEMTGLNISFGLSAYIVTRYVPDVLQSYSDELQMPVVQLTKKQTDRLFNALHVVNDPKKGHVLIELEQNIDESGYTEWASKLRESCI